MNLIIAIDDNCGIGYNGDLLYHISTDLKYFKQLTTNKVVVMGRATYQSLPKRPLPNRINIVLTSSSANFDGAIKCKDLQELFTELKKYNPNDVFVIGGASVYKELLPYCKNAYVTKIHSTTKADTFFDDLDKLKNWNLVTSSEILQENGINFEFCMYKNINPLSLPNQTKTIEKH